MRVEVEGGEGTRFLRVRSKGTETPSKDGQSWRWKESRSCWESKRPDGLAKVGSGSEPDEKGGARGWWECGMKPARGDGDVADGEGGQLGLRWSHRRSPGRQLLSSSSGTVICQLETPSSCFLFEPSLCALNRYLFTSQPPPVAWDRFKAQRLRDSGRWKVCVSEYCVAWPPGS